MKLRASSFLLAFWSGGLGIWSALTLLRAARIVDTAIPWGVILLAELLLFGVVVTVLLCRRFG